ncbi:MAG: hypothetical protein LAT54_04705 [Cryomorphaceae bacterium]|nr:hypothetical protein [Cryomorphaceae bacterium]
MRNAFILITFVMTTISVCGQNNTVRNLNKEFHKVTLEVINVVSQSDEHAVVLIKEVHRLSETSKFKPQVGEYVMVTFHYTTKPTRQQPRYENLGFDLRGVKQGDIINCQLLGDPSKVDGERVNWQVFEYVVSGGRDVPSKGSLPKQ